MFLKYPIICLHIYCYSNKILTPPSKMLELMNSMNQELKCDKEEKALQNKMVKLLMIQGTRFNKKVGHSEHAKCLLEVWQCKKGEKIFAGNG
jgi:hypothetical protein